jgi:hypothetical protein
MKVSARLRPGFKVRNRPSYTPGSAVAGIPMRIRRSRELTLVSVADEPTGSPERVNRIAVVVLAVRRTRTLKDSPGTTASEGASTTSAGRFRVRDTATADGTGPTLSSASPPKAARAMRNGVVRDITMIRFLRSHRGRSCPRIGRIVPVPASGRGQTSERCQGSRLRETTFH